MKIEMTTTASGPDPNLNWNKGQVRDVCADEARYWHEAGVCNLLEPYPADAEKAVNAPVQKAVVTPPETAVKGKAEVTPVVPEWGKGEAK